MLATRRIARLAALAVAVLGLLGFPSGAAGATNLVALDFHVSAAHLALGAPVTFYGSVTRVGGTPTNIRVDMELPASYSSGSCHPACIAGTTFEWLFPTVTGRTTFTLSTTWTGLGEKAYLFLAGGNAGTVGETPVIDIIARTPTVRTSLTFASGSPVVSGTSIHVAAAASADASPIDGSLTVQLPAGVGEPTNITGGAAYAGDPWFRVEGPVLIAPSGGFEFDLPITAANGSSLTIQAWFTTATSYARTVNASLTVKVGPDTIPPTATGPKAKLITGPNIYGVPVHLEWTGSDAGSGVEGYQLGQQIDGGAWKLVSSTVPMTENTKGRTLTAGHRYRFRVRAIDHAGNVGTWAYGTTFTLAGYQETSSAIRYAGSWSTVAWGGYAGDQARSGVAGSTARFTATSRSVSWLSVRGPTRGRATVFVNGTKVATVDLWAPEVQPRVVWAMSWSTVATRTISVTVRQVYGRPRVDVDAFYAIADRPRRGARDARRWHGHERRTS